MGSFKNTMPWPIWTHFEKLNKSHKTLTLSMITARKGSSTESPPDAGAGRREFKQQARAPLYSGLTFHRGWWHRTKRLGKEIRVCVCTSVYIIVHERYTHSHKCTNISKYPKFIIFILYANLTVWMFWHVTHRGDRVVITSFKYHPFIGNVQIYLQLIMFSGITIQSACGPFRIFV